MDNDALKTLMLLVKETAERLSKDEMGTASYCIGWSLYALYGAYLESVVRNDLGPLHSFMITLTQWCGSRKTLDGKMTIAERVARIQAMEDGTNN